MNAILITYFVNCRKVEVEYTPLEWITIKAALKHYINTDAVHPDDRKIAKSLYETELAIKEIEQDNKQDNN